jgi:hypothetical protein
MARARRAPPLLLVLLLAAAGRAGHAARVALTTPAAAASAPPLPSPRPRVHLATYAGCTSAARLPVFAAEAVASGFFDVVSAYTLEALAPEFLEAHRPLLAPPPGAPRVRGCGYWLWKPQVVLQELQRMRDGDVLVYADAGASLHRENCAAFWGYVSLAAAHPQQVVSFEMARARAPSDASWCKADAALALGLAPNGTEMAAPQLHSTYFYMARSAANVALVTAWRDAAASQGYHLLDDSASAAPNAPSFLEHRHDQALFSLLRKREAAALRVPDDGAAGGAPIQSTRCRTGAEAGCTVRRVKETLWVWARERLPGYESVAAARARRSCPRAHPGVPGDGGGGGDGAPGGQGKAQQEAAAAPAHRSVPQLHAMSAAARGA